MITCLHCGKPLAGKQTKFCCRQHMLLYNNHNMQCYKNQQSRAQARKLAFIDKLGGKCAICGYHKNSAALCFHHADSSTKHLPLDVRHLSNNSLSKLELELPKCILVCANCHAELHHPEHSLT